MSSKINHQNELQTSHQQAIAKQNKPRGKKAAEQKKRGVWGVQPPRKRKGMLQKKNPIKKRKKEKRKEKVMESSSSFAVF